MYRLCPQEISLILNSNFKEIFSLEICNLLSHLKQLKVFFLFPKVIDFYLGFFSITLRTSRQYSVSVHVFTSIIEVIELMGDGCRNFSFPKDHKDHTHV